MVTALGSHFALLRSSVAHPQTHQALGTARVCLREGVSGEKPCGKGMRRQCDADGIGHGGANGKPSHGQGPCVTSACTQPLNGGGAAR